MYNTCKPHSSSCHYLTCHSFGGQEKIWPIYHFIRLYFWFLIFYLDFSVIIVKIWTSCFDSWKSPQLIIIEKCILNMHCCAVVVFCYTRLYVNNPNAMCECMLTRTGPLKTGLTLPRNPACITWRTNSIYMNTQTSLLLRIADSRHPSPSGSLSSKTDHNMSAHRMVMPGLIGGYAHQGFSSLSSLNIKLWTERCTSRCIKQQAAAARFSTMQSTPLERGREKKCQSSEGISLYSSAKKGCL